MRKSIAYALVKQHFVITADVPLVRMSVERYAVVDDHVLQMDLAFVFASDVSDLTIRSTFHEIMRPDHQHATRVLIAGATGNATLNAVTPQATFAAGGASHLEAGVALAAPRDGSDVHRIRSPRRFSRPFSSRRPRSARS